MAFSSVTTARYWNAATNIPPIKSGIGQTGTAFIVATPGNTVIDGVTGWAVGDWIVYGLDKWYKFQTSYSQSPVLSALSVLTPTADQIPYFTGPSTADLLTFQQLRAEMELQTAYQSFTRIIHANDYASIDLAFADLGENECLELSGGQTYPCSVGAITSLPNKYCVRSDNGINAELDFSGNTNWYPTGLINNSSAIEALTTQNLTKKIYAPDKAVQLTSGSAVGQLCTVNTGSIPHGLVTGDLVFIRYGSATTAGQAAYCTEYDSDEGQALDVPVEVTRITDFQFQYTAYSGTPDPTLTIFPFVYKQNQVVFVADTSLYAVDDLVFLESNETFTSFTGTQTIAYAELNQIGMIFDSTKMWLRESVWHGYSPSDTAKISKVTKKTPIWDGVTIKGKGYNVGKTFYTQSDIGMLFHLLYRPILRNVIFKDCDFMGNWMRSCYYPYLNKCLALQQLEDAAGRTTGKIETCYGFGYGNATRGYLAVDCEARGGRHGFDEVSTASSKGMLYDWTLVRPRATDQWSSNIDTHGMNWNGKIIDPFVRNGEGIYCRNGSLVCTGIISVDCARAFHAYGRVVDVTVTVDRCENAWRDVVTLAPSTDIATPTPNSTNINVPYINSNSGGQMGLRLASPAGHKFIAPQLGTIQCNNVQNYPLYITTGAGAEVVGLNLRSVSSENFGSYVASFGKITGSFIGGIYGKKDGSFTLCSLTDATATGNTINNVKGFSNTGGTVTPFSLATGIFGNWTDSVEYESKTIVAGAILKNWRNVPMTLVDTEGGAASDDLDTINGLSYGDHVDLRTNTSTRDITLTNAGNLRLPNQKLLSTSTQVVTLAANGTVLVSPDFGFILVGSKTYDPPNLAAGASTSTTVTVTGVVLADFVKSISFGIDQAGVEFSGYVSAADTVTVWLTNKTGGAVDLASSTLYVEAQKRI